MSVAHLGTARRARGVFSITVDDESAGSESWTLDCDAVTLVLKSTITMRLPEPNRQELALTTTAQGRFLKLDVALQLGGDERRALVQLEGGRLRARIHEENAPAYENEFSAAQFEKVDFGSILMGLPLFASGRPPPEGACEISALLLPLPDLRPLEVRQSFRDLGFEQLRLDGGRALEARRIAQVSVLPGAGSVESTLWVDPGGFPLRQLVEDSGRRLEIRLASLEEPPSSRELPVLHAS